MDLGNPKDLWTLEEQLPLQIVGQAGDERGVLGTQPNNKFWGGLLTSTVSFVRMPFSSFPFRSCPHGINAGGIIHCIILCNVYQEVRPFVFIQAYRLPSVQMHCSLKETAPFFQSLCHHYPAETRFVCLFVLPWRDLLGGQGELAQSHLGDLKLCFVLHLFLWVYILYSTGQHSGRKSGNQWILWLSRDFRTILPA